MSFALLVEHCRLLGSKVVAPCGIGREYGEPNNILLPCPSLQFLHLAAGVLSAYKRARRTCPFQNNDFSFELSKCPALTVRIEDSEWRCLFSVQGLRCIRALRKGPGTQQTAQSQQDLSTVHDTPVGHEQPPAPLLTVQAPPFSREEVRSSANWLAVYVPGGRCVCRGPGPKSKRGRTSARRR